MPKEIIDYSKTIIYKIVCNDLNIKDVYVGHTTSFIKRKQKHKNCCTTPQNSKYHLKVYQIIRDYGGWENWSMIEIEKFPCNDKQEATKQERYWYEQLNAQLNTQKPNRNKKEYRNDNKDIIRENKKEYRGKNKEIIKEKKKEYYDKNIESIRKNKCDYYEANKEEISIKRKLTFICGCGTSCRIADKLRHEKSKKHQDYITQQEQEL